MARKLNADKTKEKELKENATDNIVELAEELSVRLEKTDKELQETMSNKLDDMLEFKIEKRLKEEEKRLSKRQTFRIVRLNIIILILLVLVCYFGYCLYKVDYFNIRLKPNYPVPTDKDFDPKEENPKDDGKNDKETKDDENQNKTEDEETEKRLIKDRYIKEFSYLVDDVHFDDKSLINLYSGTDISNEMKIRIAYKNIESKDIDKKDEVTTFTKEALLTSAKKIFGKRVELKNEPFTYGNTRFIYYNNAYLGFEEKEKEKFVYKHQIVDIEICGDSLEFEVILGQITEDNELINIDGKIVEEEFINKDIRDFKDKLIPHIFVFEKEEDTYIFKGVEKKIDDKIY